MPSTPPGLARVGAATLVLALLAAGCSSAAGGASGTPGAQAAPLVKVRDFRIKAPKRIAAGEVVLRVRNAGPDTHELILLRGTENITLRADNLTVDEDALKARTAGVLEDDHPGTKRDWHLSLAPGHYVLICNMSGHYLGGMHTELTVR